MITRRFVLTGLIAAPAVIAAEKLMPVHTIPKRYATVWGVGHDLEVVEHVVWDQQGALDFHKFGGGIDKFREVTDIVYGFKMPPLPKPVTLPHWHMDPAPDPLARFNYPNNVRDGEVQYFNGSYMDNREKYHRNPTDIWYYDRAYCDDNGIWRETLPKPFGS